MTAATTSRLFESSAPVPSMGTFPSAANQLFLRATMVSRNATGFAVVPTDGDGFPVMGVTRAVVDNRTGSPEHGGAAGAVDIELDYGVFGMEILGTTPLPNQVVYAVDNQTVSTDSDTGARGIAGVCVEVRDGLCYTYISPLASGLYADGDALASDVTDLQTDVAALQADALTAQAVVSIPITSFRIYSSGAALPAFSDGVNDGIDPTAESLGYKFNVASTAAIAASVLMPNDLDDTEDVIVHVLGFRVGSSDTTAALTVGAFFRTDGAAFSADANAGGDTTAFAAATTVVSEETLSIAAGDVPASPSSLLLTLVPTAALDADDLVILEVWIEYTRKLLTA
jgi:hypothetical protein